MDGIELALRFSFQPNALHYCGPERAHNDFLSYFNHNKTRHDISANIDTKYAEKIRQDLKEFEGLNPYLEFISEKTGRDFTDYKVVEAYWIGNELLDEFNDEDMKKLIPNLTQGGLPKSAAEKLVQKLPQGLFPHHNFNVFYVGVGQITGAVPTTVKNMDNCMISFGVIHEVKNSEWKNILVVKRNPLIQNGILLEFGNEELKEVEYLKEMLPNVKKGDAVAVHWNFALMQLDEKQRKNLEHYTNKILTILNDRNKVDKSKTSG